MFVGSLKETLFLHGSCHVIPLSHPLPLVAMNKCLLSPDGESTTHKVIITPKPSLVN